MRVVCVRNVKRGRGKNRVQLAIKFSVCSVLEVARVQRAGFRGGLSWGA